MRRLAQLAILSAALAVPGLARAQENDAPRAKSPAMVAVGVGTMTAGTAAVATGIGFVVLWSRLPTSVATECPGCGTRALPRSNDFLVGGTLAIVSGALAVLGGIPLVYFGAKHDRGAVAWLTPGGLAGRF